MLDTHVFLWYIAADPKLPAQFRSAVQDSANDVYVSTASVWEVVIKYQLGKRSLPFPPAEYLPRQRDAHGIAGLLVDDGTMPELAPLPSLRRDPFDRVLIAQALQHRLTMVTVDTAITAYPVTCLP